MRYKIFSKDKIVNLFSLFVLGTVTFLIWLFLNLKELYYWDSWIMIGIFSISVLCYLIIFYSIIVYYSSRWGFWIFDRIDKSRESFILGLQIFLGLVAIVGSGFLVESYWIGILVSIPSTILVIASMSPCSDWIKKWYSNKNKSKKK